MDLRLGDCLELMNDIPENSVDLLFADLPYNQTACKWDCLIDLTEFWRLANYVCKPDAPMIFTTTAKFGNLLINSNPKNFRYDLVWVKSCPVGFLNAKKMPMRKHELIYVFYNKIPTIYRENIARHHKHKFKDAEPKKNVVIPTSIVTEEENSNKNSVIYGKLKDNGYYKQRKKGEGTAYEPPLPNTILEMKSERGKHSTQKPVSLMEWILKYYSKEFDVVLDPTMGSGSMGQACKNMERLFIGFEKDAEIYDTTFKRLIAL